MLEDGVNIVQISEFLGHSDLDTTKVYLEISDRMKAEAFATIETQMDNAYHTKKWLSKIGTLRELTGLGTCGGGKKIKTFNIIRIARYAKIAMHFYFCSDFSKVLISGKIKTF